MQGLDSIISIGLQADFENPAELNRQLIQVYNFSGGQTEDDAEDNILGGGFENNSDPTYAAPGLDDHRVTFEVALCSNQFPLVCAAFFGAETASGSSPNYTHLFKSGRVLVPIFIEHQLKTGRYRRHWACVGEELSVDLNAESEGYGKAKFSFVGLSETNAGSALDGDITAVPALNRPAQKMVNGLYNAVSGGDLMGGSFSFKRTLKRVRSADGTGLPFEVQYEDASSLTGSIRTRSNDETFQGDAIAKTARTFELQLMNSGVNGIKFLMPNMRLSRKPIDISGPGGVEDEFSFRAWQTTSAAALEVRTLNQTATAVLPETP